MDFDNDEGQKTASPMMDGSVTGPPSMGPGFRNKVHWAMK